jgi:hypothetical protein
MRFAPLFAITSMPNIKTQRPAPTVHGECIGHLPDADLEHFSSDTIQITSDIDQEPGGH